MEAIYILYQLQYNKQHQQPDAQIINSYYITQSKCYLQQNNIAYIICYHSMQKSFLRVEDWAPIFNSVTNPCWLEILRIVDQFQQLVDTQKKQIIDCIRQLTSRRIQLIKLYSKYKSSLKYSGQVKKQSLQVMDSDKAKSFFHGYYSQIQQIVTAIGNNPRLFAKMLARDNSRKYDNLDFVQSILYHLYPCYIPSSIKNFEPNHCLSFVEQIINQWSYDIKLGRPSTYTVIDQIINGFNKTPEIVCYVEKISMNFMKELNNCKMDCFAFDEDAIKHEIQMKRSMALSQTQVTQPKGKWQKFKSIFKKKQDDPTKSFHSSSDTSDGNDFQFTSSEVSLMMKARQKQFLNVVIKTIISIMSLQIPFLLIQMLRFFHNKIRNEILQSNNKLKTTVSIPEINGQSKSQNSHEGNEHHLHKACSATYSNEDKKQFYRHYCYFLMTNLVCEELHNKFTISHEDTGMKPADLQNITEIIRIITQIFQAHMPEGEKYKNQKLFGQLEEFLPKVEEFYEKLLLKGQCGIQNYFQKPKFVGKEEGDQVRQILLNLHQNTLVLSFNDIRAIIGVVQNSPLINQLNLSQKSKKMHFLQDPKSNTIFEPTTKRLQFHDSKFQVQKIYFVFNSQKPNNKQVIDFYTGSQSPLKDLPLLTKSLMYGSNLNVTEALQVTKSLQLIQTLSLKQVKYFLNKLAFRYSNLYLKDSEILSDKFRQTIQLNLNRNIIRKSALLVHRDEICSRITYNEKLIQFYTQQLRSSQFYERISQAFIDNIKIKAYLRIQNDELKIYQHVNEMKGVQLQTLLMTDGQPKQKKYSQQYILRNTFKIFTTVRQLQTTIARSNITRSALSTGRRVQQFNQMFNKLCTIVVSYIEQFMKKRQILQNLNKQKLAKTIVSKIQNAIYKNAKCINALQNDISLNLAKQKINSDLFFKKDLSSLNVDWQFLFEQGKRKFDLIIAQDSIAERIRHFEEMFKMVFKIIGFSIAVNKISAEIINPIIQFLILKSRVTKHYECLYSLQTLKWNTSPQTCYNIILYESSLTYVAKMMHKDYPLQSLESQ